MDPIVIPITLFLVTGAVFIFRGPLGGALAERLRSGGADVSGVQRQLEELQQQVDGVRHELAETQERLDFAERLLTAGREPGTPQR
jgi:nucleoside-diphosphate-sugar epimerase